MGKVSSAVGQVTSSWHATVYFLSLWFPVTSADRDAAPHVTARESEELKGKTETVLCYRSESKYLVTII